MRDMVSLEYIILMGVCAFILRQFPGDLQILGLPLVQCLNVFLILCFFPVFSHMDNHLCTSMLEGDRKGRRGPAPWKKSSRLPRGKLYELWRYRTRRGEIIRRFPAWLFDLLLLLQKDSVPVALAKSAGSAPEVLREPVEELIGKLKEDPQSPEGYLSFLAEYRIPEMEGIMRRLYALSMGSGVRREVMELLIENNLNMLAQTEEQKLRLRGDLLSVSYMIPTVPVMVCMMGYGIALMYLIFQNIMAII